MRARRRTTEDPGFALVAVLVALSLLLTLSVPFVIAMGHGAAATDQRVDEKQVELASASVRDLLLHQAGLTHPALDPTPLSDDRSEFPPSLRLPEGLAALRAGGEHLLAGEVADLQRRVNVNTASPLLLGNLLGLAARLSDEVAGDGDELPLDDASRFPESGWVVVDRELVRYGAKDGDTLVDLERGMLALERGFTPAEEHVLPREALVLDYRVVLVATHSFYHAEDRRRDRLHRFGAVEEVNRIAELGFGAFSQAELDVLRRHCTVASARGTAGDWGRPERVFSPIEPSIEPWEGRSVRVRSGADIPGGSVVRLRSLDGTEVEHALVWSSRTTGTGGAFNLPGGGWELKLLLPPVHSWSELEAVVEPLLPHPVNVNTAAQEVLEALMERVAPGASPRAHGAPSRGDVGRAQARQLAASIRALRGDDDAWSLLGEGALADAEVRPFEGFEDLARRLLQPLLEAGNERERSRLMLLYRSLRGEGTGDLDQATAPITFASAPLVAYRAAALRARRAQVGARMERSGIAVAMPGLTLDHTLVAQAQFEEAFRLDRRAPFHTTWPLHLGTFVPSEPFANPPPRVFANLLPMAWPDFGFGEPRFASTDGTDDGFKLAPAWTPFGFREQIEPVAQDPMWVTQHPEGRDVRHEGPYAMWNQGPRGQGGESPSPPPELAHRERFFFTEQGTPGLVSRQALSFWFRTRDTGDQMLFDLAADDPDRNRISVRIEEGHLAVEVLDEAGLDPDVGEVRAAGTAPERTAGTWKVPLQELDLQPGTWYHVNLGVEGNRPGQITMLVDGVPRGDPELRTYLAQPIPEYVRPSEPPQPFFAERQKYLEISVESTEGFPPRGVLRIGLELFEYTSKTPVSFRCDFDDSTGGRVARMSLAEYFPEIPLDENGRPTINIEEITGSEEEVRVAPPHDVGAAVELYGYTLPVYRDHDLQIGSGRLLGSLGAFAVARPINSGNLRPIQAGPVVLGRGIDDTWQGELELGNPVPMQQGQSYPPPAASQAVSATFSGNGGYALMLQQRFSIQVTGQQPGQGGSVEMGGIELIRYSGVDGNRLTGIQRGLQNPLVPGPGSAGFITGQRNSYVLDWSPALFGGGGTSQIEPNQRYELMCYVVPITVPVQGGFVDPQVLGRSEWVQLYPGPQREADTEWVRYDHLAEGRFLMRAHPDAWRSLHRGVTGQVRPSSFTLQPGQSIPLPPQIDPGTREQNGVDYIGYVDRVEVDYPIVSLARWSLHFRGDTLTNTTSHAQPANALVTPVHRFELDWGNYGARSGRAGRNDRVALVAGSQATGSQRPAIEWHTVNWSARRPGGDPRSGRGGVQSGQERLGAYPFQLVAFQSAVRQLFIGPAERNFTRDTRLIDRLVKFPSGELPAAAPDEGLFGGSQHRDLPDLEGLVDDAVAVGRRAPAVLLDLPLDERGAEFVVRPDLLVTPQGDVVVQGDLTARFPNAGGLVAIDGEILAYETHGGGRFRIASNGRGLLGTEPRGHDEGTLVHFLDHVPAAILASGVSENAHQLVVNDIGDLPVHGGTLLLGGTELLHYTWSVERQLLEMPEWYDPEDLRTRGRGLFRGRYGTTPTSAGAGDPVVWFPHRYWDRHHERADDPEQAYFQVTWDLTPVWFRGLVWEDDRPDALVDVHCLVRVDAGAGWDADPEAEPALFRFEDGSPGDRANPIRRQGSRIEARFFTVWQPGAFDPQTFRAQAWKQAPRVRALSIDYEGEGRILSERITAR